MPSALVPEYVGVFIQVTIKGFVIAYEQTENDLCVLLKQRVHYSIIFDGEFSEDYTA